MADQQEPSQEPAQAFVVPARQLDMAAPTRWLRKGWADFKAHPRLSLVFGAVIVLVSIAVSALGWKLGRFALMATLLSGFVFIAPMIAVGLYSVSRERELGRPPLLRDSFVLARRVAGQAGVYALAQGVVILLWSRAGMMISALFPLNEQDTIALIEYFAIGTGIGAVFATVTFAMSAFSLPMVADRDVDMVTACVSSVNAVLRNKPVMLWWALLIVVLTAVGFATAFLGLAIVMPWLAYATWHGYRETLDPSAWPALE